MAQEYGMMPLPEERMGTMSYALLEQDRKINTLQEELQQIKNAGIIN